MLTISTETLTISAVTLTVSAETPTVSAVVLTVSTETPTVSAVALTVSVETATISAVTLTVSAEMPAVSAVAGVLEGVEADYTLEYSISVTGEPLDCARRELPVEFRKHLAPSSPRARFQSKTGQGCVMINVRDSLGMANGHPGV
jgi:hypothetical protein